MTKKLLCFVFLTVSIFANAQNRYDTPANATFTNTYVPMTHEEMMLRAAAEVYREKRAREDFDKYSRTAYEYLQKKQIGYFTSYANAALSTGYYNSQLYYNLGISYYLSGQKRKGKKFPLNPQLHSRSATYIKRNGLLIRKITIKSSRPFQCAYHPLTP